MRLPAAKGVSLIELMIALLIGSLLILGLIQVFGASRTAYQLSEGMSRVQENARFALDYLQRDIRLGGHFGCVNDQAHWVKEEGDPVVHLGSPLALTHPLNFRVSIQGYEAAGTAPGETRLIGAATTGWSPTPPSQITSLSPAPVPGSDILVLRYFGGRGTPVTNITGSAGAEVLDFPSTGWAGLTEEGVTSPTLFGIADCSHSDVFPGNGTSGQVSVNTSAANPATELTARYTPQPSGQTLLYRANSVVYYVGVSPASQQPALYRARANSSGGYDTPEELVEGVESLQLLFGQDNTPALTAKTPPVGNVTIHGTATTILSGASTAAEQENQWRRVGLVQVGLLMRSPQRAAATQAADAANYPRVLGTVFQPPVTDDGLYRASYETTVAVRNRLFGN